MNKSYRTVWNEALGAWVAASEITKARGKPSKSKLAAAILTGFMGASPAVHAQYTGNQANYGSTTTGSAGNTGVAIGTGTSSGSRASLTSTATNLVDRKNPTIPVWAAPTTKQVPPL